MLSIGAEGIIWAICAVIFMAGGLTCSYFCYYLLSERRSNLVGAWFLFAFGVILPQIAIFAFGANINYELFLVIIAVATLAVCINASCCGNNKNSSSCCGCDSGCNSGCGKSGSKRGRGKDSGCCSSSCGGGSSCCGCDDNDDCEEECDVRRRRYDCD